MQPTELVGAATVRLIHVGLHVNLHTPKLDQVP